MSRNIHSVVIGHYSNDRLASMERFDARIVEQLSTLEGKHEKWVPPIVLGQLASSPEGLGKWLGYFDKLFLFPLIITFKIHFRLQNPQRTLFILPDHSHGIYLYLVQKFPHVVHVHDLIAIRMAKNDFFGHRIGLTGRFYQYLIGRGLKTAKNFICISTASKDDLIKYIAPKSTQCSVVHNELNYPYKPATPESVFPDPNDFNLSKLSHPFLLHVGNHLWYKNRPGVLRIFQHIHSNFLTLEKPDLVIVGHPTSEDKEFIEVSGLRDHIHFLQDVDNPTLQMLYSKSVGLLFPSHYEGFGWPIIEAFSCGCPVLTTNRAPMTEVGSSFAHYIEPMPLHCKNESEEMQVWLKSAETIIESWLTTDKTTELSLSEARIEYSQQFSVGTAFKRYLKTYESILETNSCD